MDKETVLTIQTLLQRMLTDHEYKSRNENIAACSNTLLLPPEVVLHPNSRKTLGPGDTSLFPGDALWSDPALTKQQCNVIGVAKCTNSAAVAIDKDNKQWTNMATIQQLISPMWSSANLAERKALLCWLNVHAHLSHVQGQPTANQFSKTPHLQNMMHDAKTALDKNSSGKCMRTEEIFCNGRLSQSFSDNFKSAIPEKTMHKHAQEDNLFRHGERCTISKHTTNTSLDTTASMNSVVYGRKNGSRMIVFDNEVRVLDKNNVTQRKIHCQNDNTTEIITYKKQIE